MDDIIIHNDLVQPPTYLPMNVSEMTYFYFILFIVLFVHETDVYFCVAWVVKSVSHSYNLPNGQHCVVCIADDGFWLPQHSESSRSDADLG